MCSQISPHLADYQTAILAAVSDVAENSLFAFADVSDRAAFDRQMAGGGPSDDWLHARIRFTGPTDGEFAITLPAALARRLCAAFAGADTTDGISEGDLVDFTGEFANMVCGTWLTRACRQEIFDLSPPRVLHGCTEVTSRQNAAESSVFYLAIEETPVRLDVAWSLGPLDAPSAVPERANDH
jgi:CheY-specific phosphatase CheX